MDLYCKVFVDTDMDYEALFESILKYVDGKKEAVSYITADWCCISVRRNKEYKKDQEVKDSTGFLFWKYYLDIEPLNVEECRYIDNVAALAGWLKMHGIGVIAACDFEEAIN